MVLAKLLNSPSKSKKLTQDFYLQGDVTQIARMLLGKVLVSEIDGIRTAGIIVETEAYSAKNDRASHAYKNRRTERTRVMYEQGGRAYIYLIYGMYHLLNVVTNRAGKPDAVLIRAIEPLEGVEQMLARTKQKRVIPGLTNGPGKLTRALGITLDHYGVSLSGDLLWIEDRGLALPPHSISAGPRIGIAYAGEDAARPWRFWVKDNPFVCKQRS
ncbi:DNA-3-methyladenine glycosylase [Caldithrix abyssi]